MLCGGNWCLCVYLRETTALTTHVNMNFIFNIQLKVNKKRIQEEEKEDDIEIF
jgi:hypothetical protein